VPGGGEGGKSKREKEKKENKAKTKKLKRQKIRAIHFFQHQEAPVRTWKGLGQGGGEQMRSVALPRTHVPNHFNGRFSHHFVFVFGQGFADGDQSGIGSCRKPSPKIFRQRHIDVSVPHVSKRVPVFVLSWKGSQR